MVKELNDETIAEAAKHLDNIQSGKTPIIKKFDEGLVGEEYVEEKLVKNKDGKRILPLIPPTDPRVLMQIAPFLDETLAQFDFKDRKDLCTAMTDTMYKYGGIGLSCNQVGLPYRMFVIGGHPSIEDGKLRYCFNPEVIDVSSETILMKEGCLTFPFLFLAIKRPKWVHAKYTNENGEEVDEYLHGMPSRIWQHENEHMNGYVFTDLVSKLKLDTAKKAQKKTVMKATRKQIQQAKKSSIII
jgi:peptide deformylase|tara:strand:- start:45 stop:770 length:726 start_codon:yes stop_codon:yes gene_type:complete